METSIYISSEGSAGPWQGPAGYFLCKVPQSGPVAGDLGWGIYLSVGWSVAGANLCTQYHTDSLVHFNASFTAQFCHSVYHISSTFFVGLACASMSSSICLFWACIQINVGCLLLFFNIHGDALIYSIIVFSILFPPLFFDGLFERLAFMSTHI